MIVGAVHPDTDLDITGEMVVRKCATIVGVHNYHQDSLGMAVEFLEKCSHKYPFQNLVSQPLDLRNFDAVVQVAKSMKYHRVLVKYQE